MPEARTSEHEGLEKGGVALAAPVGFGGGGARTLTALKELNLTVVALDDLGLDSFSSLRSLHSTEISCWHTSVGVGCLRPVGLRS